MSVNALKPVLREIRADGNITLAEAQKLWAVPKVLYFWGWKSWLIPIT